MAIWKFVVAFIGVTLLENVETAKGNFGYVDRRDTLKAFYDLIKSQEYRKEIPPYPQNGAIKVHVSMFVTALSDVNEQQQEFSFSIYLRQEWMDDRLAYAHALPNTSFLDIASVGDDIIWIPDPYFESGKKEEVHDVTNRNTLLSIYPNGLVFYSQRITLTHWCHVDLTYFPLDYQYCEVKLLTYGNRYDGVVFGWMEGDPLINIKNIPLTKFQIYDVIKGDCTRTFDISGNKTSDPFSCIYARIIFKRDIGHYLLQVYIPSTLIIMLSWVSFWLDADAVPGRISLGLLTVLSMSTQMSYTVNGDMPKVSYVRAVDVWMSTCLIFLFAALVEFALVNSLARNGKDITGNTCSRSQENNLPNSSTETCAKNNNGPTDLNSITSVDRRKKRNRRFHYITPRRIDLTSRFLFPLLFVLFCVIYWIVYQEDP